MSKSALAILMIMTLAGIALGNSPVGSSCMTNGSCNAGCICQSEANCTEICNCLNITSGSCSCTGMSCTPFITTCTNNRCSLTVINADDSESGASSGAGKGKKPPALGRCPFEDL
jgi:hypothetical protein